MKLAPLPTCDCGLEDQTAEHNTAAMPASADSKNKRVVNSSPATHTKLYGSKEELEKTATFVLQTE